MEHRHLTPQEFDLLVDGEEGFGIAPLAAHVAGCVTCRTELEAQERLVGELERLPHFTPSPLFAYRVMREVQVFEPWHVAAMNTVRRFVPRSRPARVFAAGVAGVMAMTLTLATVWMATRLDAVLFLAGVTLEQMRGVASAAVASFVNAAFGQTAVSAETGFAIAASGFVLAVIVSAIGLRAVAAASRRRRM